MNEKFSNKTNREDANIADILQTVADQTDPNPIFKTELEQRLKAAHKPKAVRPIFSFKPFVPSLGWVTLIVLLGFVLSWSIRNLVPSQNPATGNGTPGFICPVTQPNGSIPPGETVNDPNYFGNGELWTGLWPNGRIYMLPENREADGSFSMKWGWWRAVAGEPLTIEGHRLDTKADLLRADIPQGYDGNFQVSALIFPTTGCWEVTGRVGDASLTFVTEVLFGEVAPTPEINATPTPISGGYDWRRTKLYLAQPLPQSPNQANVYLLNKGESITVDEVRARAERFGIQGEVYNATDPMYKYAVTDGKQRLSVGSSRHFFYTSDFVKYARNSIGVSNDNAESIIREFMQARGFDFPFNISNRELFGGYVLQQIAPDGLPMQYEYFSLPVARVTLDENGEVLAMDADWVDFNQTPVGTYGIITADEALQKLLDDNNPYGEIESVHSGGGVPPQQWYRQYPDEQEVTIYGGLTIAPAVDSSKPALITIDGTMAVGNTNGLEALENYAFIQATGKYVTENGIRKFNIDSWDINTQQTYFPGMLDEYQGQIILITATDDGTKITYPLIDPPVDAPLNTDPQKSQLSVNGVIVDGKLDWTNIQYFADASQIGGGGGGGGMGFYKLNLSGTPIPFPTPTSTPTINSGTGQYKVKAGDTLSSIASAFGITVDELKKANGITDPGVIYIDQMLVIPGNPLAGQKIEGTRGMLTVNIYNKEDGSQRVEYGFVSNDPQSPYFLLEGDNLQELQQYHNKPVTIWGSVNRTDAFGTPVISVEKYEIPFPDLKPQILKGIEKSVKLNGEDAVLFTAEDGKAYVEFTSSCNYLISTESMSGTKGSNSKDKSVLLETLAIPDLSFANYPGICVFSSAPATQPNGDPIKLTISSDQPNVMPEPPTSALHPPKLTIDKVELMYYVSNPTYQANDPSASQRESYLQPVWHFHGRYENGDEFDAMIQALKQEFLSPELGPYIQGG